MSMQITHPQNVFKKREKVNMSDDLVKRLRWLGDHASFEPHMHHTAASRIEKLEAQLAQSQLKRWAARWEEQADRIEKLEAALRIVINWDSTLESEDGLDWGEVMDIASIALEGKDESN